MAILKVAPTSMTGLHHEIALPDLKASMVKLGLSFDRE